MKIFAIGDMHLSFDQQGNEYKPMNIFGEQWLNHSVKIRENWLKVVSDDDIVLMPGDISWAMELEEAMYDLEFLHQLPGRKFMIKGNHELWWDTISKVRKILPDSIFAIQNDSIILNDVLGICGTRGWQCPEGEFANEHDAKIYARELGRLALSLNSIPKHIKHKIVMLHFPPTNWKKQRNEFIDLLEAHEVETCLYGHLHGYAIQNGLFDEQWGIKFQLVSADYLNFMPICIAEI